MKKVLVVEDDKENRALLTRFLSRQGYEVVHAEDGLRGLQMAQSEKPDMILMDLDMPKLDGWEATRRIKANPAIAHIPILVLTAHFSQADVTNARYAGCNGFEVKPILYVRLMQKVRQLLEASQADPGY